MSGFEVDTWGLDQLRKFFEQLAGHAETGKSYLTSNTSLDAGEGWINDLSGAHDSITQQGSDWFRDFADATLDPAGAAITDTIAYYNSNEAETAAGFDSQIEGVAAADPIELAPSSTGPGSNPTTFGIAVNPEDSLTAPWQDEYKFNWDLTRYIGMTGMLRNVFIDVTALMAAAGLIEKSIDPYDTYTVPVAGDWAAMRSIADVYGNLANAVDSFELALLQARRDLPEVWTGNAATACDFFVEDLRSKLPDAASELRDIADIYQTASEGADEFGKVVDYVIDQIGDAIIVVSLAVAGGVATAATGIGPLIAGGVALWEIKIIIDGLQTLADAKGVWESTFGAAKSSMDSFGQINASGYYLPSLPQPNAEGSSMSHLPG